MIAKTGFGKLTSKGGKKGGKFPIGGKKVQYGPKPGPNEILINYCSTLMMMMFRFTLRYRHTYHKGRVITIFQKSGQICSFLKRVYKMKSTTKKNALR